MSAEPSRKKAYSPDLRWRIVYQRIGMNLPYYKIAQNLNIAASTVHRTYQLFEETGKVDSVPHTDRPGMRALGITGMVVSASTVCRLLKRYGFTRKKIRQRDVRGFHGSGIVTGLMRLVQQQGMQSISMDMLCVG